MPDFPLTDVPEPDAARGQTHESCRRQACGLGDDLSPIKATVTTAASADGDVTFVGARERTVVQWVTFGSLTQRC